MRVSLPVERALAHLVQHAIRCHVCTAGLCLAAIWQARAEPRSLRLCRVGRVRLARVDRLWNPAAPITVRRMGRMRLFSVSAGWRRSVRTGFP